MIAGILRPAERNHARRSPRGNNRSNASSSSWTKTTLTMFVCGRKLVGRSRIASATLLTLSAVTISTVFVMKLSNTGTSAGEESLDLLHQGSSASGRKASPYTASRQPLFEFPAPPSWRNLLRSLHPASFPHLTSSSSVKPNSSSSSSSRELDDQMFDQIMLDIVAAGDAGSSKSKHKLPFSINKNKGRTTTLVGYAAEESDKVFKNLTMKFCVKMLPPKQKDIRSGGPPPWQHPNETNLYLYSAYYDGRLQDKPFVRVIGMMKGLEKPEKKYFCQLWFNKTQLRSQYEEGALHDDGINDGVQQMIALEVPALTKEIWWAHWDSRPDERKYRPYLISCPVARLNGSGNTTDAFPTAVSLSTTECRSPSSFLPVMNNFNNNRTKGVQGSSLKATDEDTRDTKKYNFVVCVKGLDFMSDNTEQLLEWMEMQKLLGASNIVAHVFRLHPEARKALALYEAEGFLTLVPFTLPGKQPNDPNKRAAFLRGHLWQKRRNELVPYNDCFYRHVPTADFVVPLDVDELILPSTGLTWSDIVDSVKATKPFVLDDYASLAVQNVYFFKNATTRPDPNIPGFLPMMRQDQRSANFSQLGRSVKSFVSTSKALTVFNHYALHPLSSRVKAQYWVPKELAQMNHYRTTCPIAMRKSCMNNWFKFTVKDDIMLRYRPKLEVAVKDKLKQLGRIT